MAQALVRLHTLSNHLLQQPVKDICQSHLLSLDAFLSTSSLLQTCVFQNARQRCCQLLSEIQACQAFSLTQDILEAVTASKQAADVFTQQRHEARKRRLDSEYGSRQQHAAQQERAYQAAESRYQRLLRSSQATLQRIEHYTADILCKASELEQQVGCSLEGKASDQQTARAFATQAWRMAKQLPLDMHLGRWGLASSALLVQLHSIQVHLLRHASGITLTCEGGVMWTSEDPKPRIEIKLNAKATSSNLTWTGFKEVPATAQPLDLFILQTGNPCYLLISMRTERVRPGWASFGPESVAQRMTLDRSSAHVPWSAEFRVPGGGQAQLTMTRSFMTGLQRNQSIEETEGNFSAVLWCL